MNHIIRLPRAILRLPRTMLELTGLWDEKDKNLTLANGDIKKFSGSEEDWKDWEIETEGTLSTTGYAKILSDRRYANRNPNKNRIVFTQLVIALQGGTARCMADEFETSKDGHALWRALHDEYTGTEAQAPLVSKIRQQIEATKLHPGVTASEYVNSFRVKKSQLDKFQSDDNTTYQVKELFIRNIVDPEYRSTRESLMEKLTQGDIDLKKMGLILKTKENWLKAEKRDRKRTRRMIETSSDSSDDEVKQRKKLKKTRRVNDGNDDTHTIKVDHVCTNEQGKLRVSSDVWRVMDQGQKDFILKYNKAVQHQSPLPDAPTGLTIIKNTTQDSGRKRRAKPENEEDSPEPTDDEMEVEDIKVPDKRKGVTFKRRNKRRTRAVTGSMEEDTESHVLIFDTGGGNAPTITSSAWHIIGQTGLRTNFQGYGENAPVTECDVVHAVTKAHISGFSSPVLLQVHNASLIEDTSERESLLTLMDMIQNSVRVNGVTPPEFGGGQEKGCGITVDDCYLPFSHDEEKLFFRIEKPTIEEINEGVLELYKLNNQDPDLCGIKMKSTLRNKVQHKWKDISLDEWSRRLGRIPEEVVKKTLENTTQHYLEIESENRLDPRRHFTKRFHTIQFNRRNEEDATDTIFPSVTSGQGHTCSQFFVGVNSKVWHVTPLKKESQNHVALQEHLRKNGAPRTLISDNASSEIGSAWTRTCREQCIVQRTSEPHQPNQNPAEPEIGRFSRMVRRNMRDSGAPLGLHNWCQLYCVQVNNVTARRSLDWRTPLEVQQGHTPDISPYRYMFYEPIWYFRPSIKSPQDNLAKARYLCLAESSGDAMTYFILTELETGKPKVLIRSVIRSRRKNIDTDESYVNEDPKYESFFFTDDEGRRIVDEEQVDQAFHEVNDSDHHIDDGEDVTVDEEDINQASENGEPEPTNEENIDAEETLSPESNATNDIEDVETIRNAADPFLDQNFEFSKILDHRFDGLDLLMKVRYRTQTENETIIEIPWKVLKKDYEVECARYIRLYVMESTRQGTLKKWADQVLKKHNRRIKRLYRIYGTFSRYRTRRNAKKPSRNTRWEAKPNKEMYGYRIPNNVREALELDKENGNNYWADAIAKEMNGLIRLEVFEFVEGTREFNKNDGWQKAPLRMIFVVKSEFEDGHHRHKARFVIGGHRLDSSKCNTFSSTVKSLSVRLLLVIAEHQNLSVMTADVANAFCTAPCHEKVWVECGEEFGDRKGQRAIIRRALYGMASASRSFHDFLSDILMEIGFRPSRADPDLLIKASEDYDGYDYVATWVDDLIVVAKKPEQYISLIEQQFVLRNIEHSPSHYLGLDLKRKPNGNLHLSAETYIKEVLRKYEKDFGTVKKENSPMATDCHPELSESPYLNEGEHRLYQRIIGICQWICTSGRLDIMYATSSLSRFASAPRKDHLDMAVRILGYLKKYQKKGIVVDARNPLISDDAYEQVEFTEDFGSQYKYFSEPVDPKIPEPKIKGLSLMFFSDSDHGHDLVTGRSITGLVGMVGCTPVVARSTRQTCVQTSTFGAERTALKTTAEEVIEVRYFMRSMGVEVNTATPIFVDNQGVVLNVTNPASSLNKKALALAYHFVRENQHGKVLDVRKVGTDDNYGDPFTKPLNSNKFHSFFYELMEN